MTISMRYAARSDVGLLRDGNEDSLYAGPRLLAIADGMGGHVAGEVASSVVIATLAHLDADAPGSDLLGALQQATQAANTHLRDMVSSDRHLEGMGTTLTAMLVDRGRVGLIHIGDSRGYLLRDGELTRITRDHSLVQNLVDEGRITAEEATHHPQRSLILRALDGRDDIDADLSIRELRVGDRYLLCSDGLTDVVTERTIQETLTGAGDPQGAVDRLIDLALRSGGPDNITCIVADVVDTDPSSDQVLVAGAAAENDVRNGPSPDTAAGRAALAARAARATREAGRPPPSDQDSRADRSGRRSRRRGPSTRVLSIVGAVVVVIGAAILGTWLYLRAQYYVGTDSNQVTIMEGVSGSFLGIPLHSVHSRSDITIGQLPEYQREQVQNGIGASSLPAAQRIVDRLRTDACATAPLPPPGNVGASRPPTTSTPGPAGSTVPAGSTPTPTPAATTCAGAAP